MRKNNLTELNEDKKKDAKIRSANIKIEITKMRKETFFE